MRGVIAAESTRRRGLIVGLVRIFRTALRQAPGLGLRSLFVLSALFWISTEPRDNGVPPAVTVQTAAIWTTTTPQGNAMPFLPSS